MSAKEKATGWKIPLIFCAIVICVVVLGSFFIGPDKKPDIPADLLERASKIKIDLDSVPDWKENLLNAAGGFHPREVKDAKISIVIDRALQAGKFDIACAATSLMSANMPREKELVKIFQESIPSCENIVWAVFALHGLEGNEESAQLEKMLKKRWEECAHKKLPSHESR